MQPNERLKGVTFCTGKAGLAKGTTSGTIKTANAINFAIDGYGYTKGATDNIAVTALPQQAVSQTGIYAIWIDTGGNVSVTQGSVVSTADLAAGNVALKHGNDQSGKCLIGLWTVVTDATHTFTAGTTDPNATGVTSAFYDVMGGTVRPRTTA